MWEYLIYVCFIATLGSCVILRLLKLNTKWDRSPTCLVGKTTIVTGANSGIGFYTAQEFAKRGARVILACRNITRAEEAKIKIVEATKNNNVHVRIVDFASLKSIREFAKGINGSEERLDILVNNAGVIISKNETTVDGLSKSMQVNHFGPFLLTLLLIELIKKSKPSRIVNITSASAKYARINVNDLNFYSDSLISKITLLNYANTKLCNILFTNELSRRLRGSGVTVNSVHPGIVHTGIARHLNATAQQVYECFKYLFKTGEEGAQTSIYVALSKEIEYVTGEYFSNCDIAILPCTANDAMLAKSVWNRSAELVKLRENEYSL
ncbi:hypothetical protein RI129_007582 [Pyrocoelia pectoralis]|uniref:Uncharacterized protein n=1 Tax=Pyrocoelia pectoralis TaxID=417401 RepID=A0AAN7V9Y3_9COLE